MLQNRLGALENVVAELRLKVNALEDDNAALRDIIRNEIEEKMESLEDKLARLDVDFNDDGDDEDEEE